MGFKNRKMANITDMMVMMDMVSIIRFRIYYNNCHNHFLKRIKSYNLLIIYKIFSISVKTVKTGKIPQENRYPFYAQKQYILP